jgi:hypothetical protein
MCTSHKKSMGEITRGGWGLEGEREGFRVRLWLQSGDDVRMRKGFKAKGFRGE